MSFILRAFVAGCLLAAIIATTTRADDKPSRRTITVTGNGEVTATPDLALVSFAVETQAKTASAAATENAAKSEKVVSAVKQQLKGEDKVETSGYSLEPQYQMQERGNVSPPSIVGYVARNQVEIQIQAIDAVGRLIDSAIAAGANRINNVQFTLKDRSPHLRAALTKAGAEARAQAESVATALGVQLKQVVSATTSSGPIVVPRYRDGFAMAAEKAVTTPLEPGEVKVSASLEVTYEIE